MSKETGWAMLPRAAGSSYNQWETSAGTQRFCFYPVGAGVEDPGHAVFSSEAGLSPFRQGQGGRGNPVKSFSLRVLFHLSSRCESHIPPVIICPSPYLIVIWGSVVFERSPS